MDNLVIIGVNTRPEVTSAKKLNYNVKSSSYFTTIDFPDNIEEKHILEEESNESCGLFEENYSPLKLLENGEEFLKDADGIILTSGLTAEDFTGKFSKYTKKIIGNKKTKHVSNKYKFYNKNSNEFLMPITFLINDIYELNEILKEYNNIQFIAKPNHGSGGYNTILLNYEKFIENKNIKNMIENIINNLGEILIQEYIEGINLSSSVLSSKTDAKTIMNTRLLTLDDIGFKNNYKYCGNILPLDIKTIQEFTNIKIPYDEIGMKNLNEDMNLLSEEIIKKQNLIGSNGVDLILSSKENETNNILDNDIYLIEVNPRFQGTYELIEKVLSINLLEEHINACNGEIIQKLNPKGHCIKEIIYSPNRIKQGNLEIENLYDISRKNTIIEKDEPLVTIIKECNNIKKGLKEIKNLKNEINKNIYRI